MERGLRGVRLVISDDHPSIRGAVMAELPGARWRRLARDVLAHVPSSEREAVAGDLKEVFTVKRRGTAESLTQGFMERYGGRLERAVEVFARGIEEALTYPFVRYLKSPSPPS